MRYAYFYLMYSPLAKNSGIFCTFQDEFDQDKAEEYHDNSSFESVTGTKHDQKVSISI